MSYICRYQNELPKKIKSRGKEGHLTHEELVQLIKWKLAVSYHLKLSFVLQSTSMLEYSMMDCMFSRYIYPANGS